MRRFQHQLFEVFSGIENRLSSYYEFQLAAPAIDHLIDRDSLLGVIGETVTELPEWQARASCWFVEAEHESEGLFIGMHIDEHLLERVLSPSPLVSLSQDNLDAFAVLVEEISHFHLLLNRARAGLKVSHLELEWQGEIDKMLVAAMLLDEQVGDPHVVPLARKLFDLSTITAKNEHLYWTATKYAAQFWYGIAEGTPIDSALLRRLLHRAYHGSWTEKMDSIHSLSKSAA